MSNAIVGPLLLTILHRPPSLMIGNAAPRFTVQMESLNGPITHLHIISPVIVPYRDLFLGVFHDMAQVPGTVML